MPKEIVDTFPNTHAGLATSSVVLRYMRKKDRSHRYSRHFPRGLRSIKFHIVKESWHKPKKRIKDTVTKKRKRREKRRRERLGERK